LFRPALITATLGASALTNTSELEVRLPWCGTFTTRSGAG